MLRTIANIGHNQHPAFTCSLEKECGVNILLLNQLQWLAKSGAVAAG